MADTFDPDAYLAKKGAPSFDPDAYLAKKAPPVLSSVEALSSDISSAFSTDAARYQRQAGRAANTQIPTAPTPQELGSQYGEVAKGVAAGIPGQIGDVLELGRAGAAKVGLPVPETKVPFTSEGIGNAIFGEAEPGMEKYRRLGEVGGGFIGGGALAKGIEGTAAKLIGRTSKSSEDAAAFLESKGIKPEPGQLRTSKPTESPGFGTKTIEENQRNANLAATEPTGAKADAITPKFIGERLQDLGKSYESIFNRPIKADETLVKDLRQMRDFENSIGPAKTSKVASAADVIIKEYDRLQSMVGDRGTLKTFPVDGEVLHALRKELSAIARTASDGNTRRVAGDFVERIDENLGRNHKDLLAKLKDTNRKYSATKVLEELVEKNGIRNGDISLKALGDHLAQNVYGFGSGTTKHPLYDLGFAGRSVNQTARWQAPEEKGLLSALSGKAEKALGAVLGGPIGPRSRVAREVQKRISKDGGTPLRAETAGATAAALAPETKGDE